MTQTRLPRVRALVLDIPGYTVIGEASDGAQVLEGKAQHSGVREHANDATLLILINAWHEGVSFKLPDDEQTPLHWKLMVSTDEALDRAAIAPGEGRAGNERDAEPVFDTLEHWLDRGF